MSARFPVVLNMREMLRVDFEAYEKKVETALFKLERSVGPDGNHRHCDDPQRRAAVLFDEGSAARYRLHGLDRDQCCRLISARNGDPWRAGVTHASGSGCVDRVGGS